MQSRLIARTLNVDALVHSGLNRRIVYAISGLPW